MLSYVVTAIVIGVVTACRGGLLRDVLVSDRAAPVQTRTALRACRFDRSKPVHVAYLVLQNTTTAAVLLAIACCFVFRILAIAFDWKTVSVLPTSPEQS